MSVGKNNIASPMFWSDNYENFVPGCCAQPGTAITVSRGPFYE